MKVAVIGAGYVGLTTAACFAHLGHDVLCADIDSEKVARLQKGEVPILELGLPELIKAGLASRKLEFVVGAATAALRAEIVFLCVQTPQGADGAADLSFVESVAREIAPVLAANAVVVNKSTVPVGSTRFVQRILSEAGARADGVTVASNPEFLREGQAVRDFLNPDRIVIGCDDRESAVRVSELYKGVGAPVLVTDPASAEMIKYASNAFLATKVSFINAIANLCEAVDADAHEVAIGMGYDTRIGFQFLHPGPGYGGSCFPKDVAALLHISNSAGYAFELLGGVVDVNEAQHERMIDKVRVAVGGSLSGMTVGIWGLTFKADTDDLRDSPAMFVARRLIEEGVIVRAYDPGAGDRPRSLVPGIELCADAFDAATGADALVLLTEWDEFRWLDFDRVRDAMQGRAIVDARNLLDPAAMRRRGFVYQGVGRR
ncbi:MAG TPA: UDP-glucose/GDP-mannose dehydrogenase family protein [Acidimicrobiia bacterium]|nr:UDP-glucose/GDP-mannose dehydrogenase family protein [Acidimicrobiia bacterium]